LALTGDVQLELLLSRRIKLKDNKQSGERTKKQTEQDNADTFDMMLPVQPQGQRQLLDVTHVPPFAQDAHWFWVVAVK
jgi:hypothetical protein